MEIKGTRFQFSNQKLRCLTALLCAALLVPGETLAWAAFQEQKSAAPASRSGNRRQNSG